MTTATPRGSRSDTDAAPGHRNDVSLAGCLVDQAQERVLADGQEVTTFRLTVRAPGADGSPTPAERIDCVAITPALRKRVGGFGPGDLIEVAGSLRHRYWRSGGVLADRYEVIATSCRRVRRGPG